MRTIKIGYFLILQYENEFFPGKETNIQKNRFLISMMKTSGAYQKWSEKKEELFHEKEIIEELLKKSAKGAYSIPKIVKHLNYIPQQ